MNYTEHDIELAERYVDGELTPEQKKAVVERMKSDEAFTMLIRKEEAILKGIRYDGLRKDLDFLKDLEATLPNTGISGTKESGPKEVVGKQVSFNRYWAPLSAAAAVLLLAVAWFGLIRKDTPEELYAAHFKVFDSPGSGLTRGDNNALSNKARAYQAYDLGKYDEAIGYFKLAIQHESDDAIAHLCLGNAYMATGDFVNAEGTFNHVIKDHGGDLLTPAKWYLALTYLKQGKLERTRSVLWEISDSGTYGEEAKGLLKELD